MSEDQEPRKHNHLDGHFSDEGPSSFEEQLAYDNFRAALAAFRESR